MSLDAIPEYALARFQTYGIEATFDQIEGEPVRFTTGKCFPGEDQVYFAEKFCELANLQYAHDGRWQIVWTRPKAGTTWDRDSGLFKPFVPQVLMSRWFNQAGQVVFEVVFDQMTFDEILDKGVTFCVKQSEVSWQSWNEHIWKDVVGGDGEHIADALENAAPLSGNLSNQLKKSVERDG
jgi:hypothetical protein